MTAQRADELIAAFAANDGPHVIGTMLGGAATEERVEEVMQSLEEMAQHRVEIACCLMISLWPVASDLMMHDVCDAIDLWIDANRSPVVIDHLGRVAAGEIDPDLKRHLEGLLSIEENG